MVRATILVTGANGFIGAALCRSLLALPGRDVRGSLRGSHANLPVGLQPVQVATLDGSTDWQAALAGVDLVVHTAARVHVMHDSSSDPLAAFRQVNVGGTLNLARQAAMAGVKRFIFISSIKVNGEANPAGRPYQADDSPAPGDAYGVSKSEAEQGLWQLSAETAMEVVVIRPVLVYGPGVKANFHSMMRWLHKGVPLPLGAVDNRRSLVSVANLVDLIQVCMEHPRAANQTFLVSDGNDVSLSQLLRMLGQALGRPARLLPVPSWLLRSAASAIGRRNVALRLFGSLQVDISKNHQLLGWTPPYSLEQGLEVTAHAFLQARSS
ncbi:UDP-glucose 4-epimerase family protein [Pseudomonas shirazensis]|uniref:UDP-glucose 4-epimerase family protein n=1 Tax=Pseudomonas shirazensis TaxID=2745494 RepID=UPI003D001B07